MALILPGKMPAIEELRSENVLFNTRFDAQCGCKPLRVAILNLMPLKEEAEVDLLRALSVTSLPIEIHFMRLRSHVSRHVSEDHLNSFYEYFDAYKGQQYDGFIINGVPVELMDFEEVDFWNELTDILDWVKTNVRSSLYICWGAQAGLYYHYGINKHLLPKKKFGIFRQQTFNAHLPIFRGFDDYFQMPHSRHTEVDNDSIMNDERLTVMASSEDSGVGIVMARDGREFFILGHMEYPAGRLDKEYHRDLGKRDDVEMPVNYYKDNDERNKPVMAWRAHALLLFNNWLNYYVNPASPYGDLMSK